MTMCEAQRHDVEVETMEQVQTELVETITAFAQSDLASGTSGNLSARTDDGMLITPSSVAYQDIGQADLVSMSPDARWATTRNRRPSSEWRLHLDIYAHRPDAHAVVHCHPRFATALAVHSREIGPFHYMVAVAGGANIRCAGYATFGSQELSDNVLAALEDRRACLMAHHGLVTVGDSPAAALALAIEVEALAAHLLTALALGEPPLLSDGQMNDVLNKMQSGAGYGSSPGEDAST